MSRAPRPSVLVESLESRLLFATGELIRNGSFEGVVAASDWTRTGFVASTGAQPHSGLGYAYLADANGNPGDNVSGSIYQQVTIPASAELKLSFWTKITTNETTTTAQNDLLRVQVTNADGTSVLHSAATFSNLDKSTTYIKRTYTLPNSLKGQTVRILFSGSTNATAGTGTTFRVDDVGLSTKAPDLSKKIVGYVPTYRQGLFAQMDLNLVTHINYFAVKVNNDGSLNTSGVSDTNLATVVNAAHAKGVGVSITVGPQSFATVAASAAARAKFATDIVAYCVARNLDGVDIDWEPPATGTNYANYALLINDLFAKTGPANLKLTAATNPWTQEIPVAATNQMDWVNVMCYDFHYANNSTYEAAIDGMIQWSDYGVEKHKLLMGTPFYGRSGTSWSDSTSKTYAAFFNEYTALHGAPPPPDGDVFIDAAGKTWYVNGVTTIQKKMAWVRDNGYGGAMIWELGQDHWDANAKYDQYSLGPVINSMLRPPAWLTPASGSRFNFVNKSFYMNFGAATVNATAGANDLNFAVTGGTLNLNATQRLASMSITGGSAAVGAGGNKVVVLKTAPTITGGGKLDLRDNNLIVRSTAANRAAATNAVTAFIKSGFNMSGTKWAGSGITTSLGGDGVNNLRALGVALNDLATAGGPSPIYTIFAGETVGVNDVLVRYTLFGDADLDGRVTTNDYFTLDNGFLAGKTGWINGDFDYDGAVTTNDYFVIDNGFLGQNALPSPADSPIATGAQPAASALPARLKPKDAPLDSVAAAIFE